MKFEESPYHTGQFLTIPSTGSGIALRHVEDKPFDRLRINPSTALRVKKKHLG
jgi:hypothetical protein